MSTNNEQSSYELPADDSPEAMLGLYGEDLENYLGATAVMGEMSEVHPVYDNTSGLGDPYNS